MRRSRFAVGWRTQGTLDCLDSVTRAWIPAMFALGLSSVVDRIMIELSERRMA